MTAQENQKKAHEIYRVVLNKIIEPLIGKDTTFLDQLDGIGHKFFGVKFKGVYPSDRIPKLNDLSPYCILNLDKSDEPGSHWIALAKHGIDTYIYDSFGREHVNIIPNLRFSGNGKILDVDTSDREQEIAENNCGQRCLSFLAVFDQWGVDLAKLI